MAYLHPSASSVHDVIVWYEDISVAVVFTMWAYDWLKEKFQKKKGDGR